MDSIAARVREFSAELFGFSADVPLDEAIVDDLVKLAMEAILVEPATLARIETLVAFAAALPFVPDADGGVEFDPIRQAWAKAGLAGVIVPPVSP